MEFPIEMGDLDERMEFWMIVKGYEEHYQEALSKARSLAHHQLPPALACCDKKA